MQVYDFNVPTNGSFPIGAVGKYIKYLSGNAGGSDPTIKVQAGRNGETAILMPGQALTFPASWNDFTLSSYAATQAIIGKVLIGNGRMDDSTVQGTVQVVDGGKFRSLANVAFGGNAYIVQTAAQYGRMQLWNPVGSGKRLVVEALTAWGGAACNIVISSSTAVLTGAGVPGVSKNLGGAISTALIYADANVTQGLGVVGNGLSSYPVVAAQLQNIKPNEPIIVQPGLGLLLTGNVVNNQLQANFEWYEELNA